MDINVTTQTHAPDARAEALVATYERAGYARITPPILQPAELFLDPNKPLVGARVAWKLLKKKLGFRTLLDVIPLDATLVRGSHGRKPGSRESGPVFITSQPEMLETNHIDPTAVCDLILRHVFE